MSVLPAMRMLPSADLCQGHVRRRPEVDVSACRLACGPLAVSLGGVWSLDLPLQLRLFPATGMPRKCWSAPLEARF